MFDVDRTGLRELQRVKCWHEAVRTANIHVWLGNLERCIGERGCAPMDSSYGTTPVYPRYLDPLLVP
jgi:hypothetical protein